MLVETPLPPAATIKNVPQAMPDVHWRGAVTPTGEALLQVKVEAGNFGSVKGVF